MNENTPDILTKEGVVMGGPWRLRLPQGADMDTAADAAFAALSLVDQQMSTYKPTSDLMLLNAAPVGAWHPVPGDLLTVLTEAGHWSALSDGAIDITLGRVVNAWGFGPDETPQTTPDLPHASITAPLELRADPPAVRKTAAVQLDLCALAKGFAVDQAARALCALGHDSFLIEAAGEIYAQGLRPDGDPWTIGLELPIPDKQVIYDQVALDGAALASSGQYRNQREIDGNIHGHTIDPRSGQPLNSDLLSVTVRHDSCMSADALATVLLILGPDAGMDFAQHHGLCAQFVCRDPEGAKILASSTWVEGPKT